MEFWVLVGVKGSVLEMILYTVSVHVVTLNPLGSSGERYRKCAALYIQSASKCLELS